MNVDRHPLGGRHHLIRSLSDGPNTDIYQIIALKLTDTYTDFLELVLGKHGDCLVHYVSPPSLRPAKKRGTKSAHTWAYFACVCL